MASDGSSREARRRRIAERGSDRLALITGRVQTLPPSPSPSDPQVLSSSSFPSSQQHDLLTGSSAPLISQDQDLHSNPHLDKSSVSLHGSDSSMLPSHDSSIKSSLSNGYNGGSTGEPYLLKSETSIEGLRAPVQEVSDKVQPSLVSTTIQRSSIPPLNTEQHLEPRNRDLRAFTPYHIGSAITSLEHTRIFCSATVALLAVLSYFGFPLLGSSFIKSTILSRPLYLVLLTNLTFLLARLLQKQRNLERDERGAENVSSQVGDGLAEQLGKALEVGLMLQKVIEAVFMDCSVYAIIVICGLALAQQLH